MGEGGGRNFLLERGDKPEKEGVNVEKGGCHFFYQFKVQSHLLCVRGK